LSGGKKIIKVTFHFSPLLYQQWKAASGTGEQILRGAGGAAVCKHRGHRHSECQTRQMQDPKKDGGSDPADEEVGAR